MKAILSFSHDYTRDFTPSSGAVVTKPVSSFLNLCRSCEGCTGVDVATGSKLDLPDELEHGAQMGEAELKVLCILDRVKRKLVVLQPEFLLVIFGIQGCMSCYGAIAQCSFAISPHPV